MILNYIIQITLGLFLILLLAFIGFYIFNYESLVLLKNSTTLKKEIIVFDGIMDFSSNQIEYETKNITSNRYKNLAPSVNQNGGAEYSYNFWMYKDNDKLSNSANLSNNPSDIILLLRGVRQKILYKTSINNTGVCPFGDNTYILVKNPLIRMAKDGSAIIVEYNTITNPDAFRENGKNANNCNGTLWKDRNKGLLGIYNLKNNTFDKKWFMFTVTLQELSPENDIIYKNRTSCKIFINGINVLDKVVESPYTGSNTIMGSSVMKHNTSPLYLNPGNLYSENGTNENPVLKESMVQMANLTYYNYALTELEIQNIFANKFSTELSVEKLDGNNILDDKYEIAFVSDHLDTKPKALGI